MGVFFEAVERLAGCLRAVAGVVPEARVAVVHEVTKVYEGVHVGGAPEVAQFYHRAETAVAQQKGECVVCVEGGVGAGGERGHGGFAALEVQRHVATLVRAGYAVGSAVPVAAMNLEVPIPVVRRVVQEEMGRLGLEGWSRKYGEEGEEEVLVPVRRGERRGERGEVAGVLPLGETTDLSRGEESGEGSAGIEREEKPKKKVDEARLQRRRARRERYRRLRQVVKSKLALLRLQAGSNPES